MFIRTTARASSATAGAALTSEELETFSLSQIYLILSVGAAQLVPEQFHLCSQVGHDYLEIPCESLVLKWSSWYVSLNCLAEWWCDKSLCMLVTQGAIQSFFWKKNKIPVTVLEHAHTEHLVQQKVIVFLE